MLTESIWIWVGFLAFVLSMLALDLGVFHRKAHAVTLKEAGIWVSVWVSLALAFNVLLAFWKGSDKAIEFFTGYVIELSLSVDNMFVFALIFTYFRVPNAYQHRILFWGIMGALVMRGIFIFLGAALLDKFHWMFYIFGAFLIFTGIRLARQKDEEMEVEKNVVVRMVRKVFPVTKRYHGQRFFIRRRHMLLATPMLVVLMAVESTDLVFALDSVPAIFAVTTDPFIVFTSNVFAILGLRSLYFMLAGIMDKFHYLKLGLAVVLVYVGVKMVASDIYHVPGAVSLAVILGVLGTAVLVSLLRAKRLARIEQFGEARPESAAPHH